MAITGGVGSTAATRTNAGAVSLAFGSTPDVGSWFVIMVMARGGVSGPVTAGPTSTGVTYQTVFAGYDGTRDISYGLYIGKKVSGTTNSASVTVAGPAYVWMTNLLGLASTQDFNRGTYLGTGVSPAAPSRAMEAASLSKNGALTMCGINSGDGAVGAPGAGFSGSANLSSGAGAGQIEVSVASHVSPIQNPETPSYTWSGATGAVAWVMELIGYELLTATGTSATTSSATGALTWEITGTSATTSAATATASFADFDLISVSPSAVESSGGDELVLTGVFPDLVPIAVHVGPTGTSADAQAYSLDSGYGVESPEGTTLTVRVPPLAPGVYSVSIAYGELTDALIGALTVNAASFKSGAFNIRSALSPIFAVGPRSLDKVPQ